MFDIRTGVIRRSSSPTPHTHARARTHTHTQQQKTLDQWISFPSLKGTAICPVHVIVICRPVPPSWPRGQAVESWCCVSALMVYVSMLSDLFSYLVWPAWASVWVCLRRRAQARAAAVPEQAQIRRPEAALPEAPNRPGGVVYPCQLRSGHQGELLLTVGLLAVSRVGERWASSPNVLRAWGSGRHLSKWRSAHSHRHPFAGLRPVPGPDSNF